MDLLLKKLALIYPKSLLAEFCTIFGMQTTHKLLTVFGGITLKIPTSRELQKTERDLQIYEQLAKIEDKQAFRIVRKTLEAKHGMSKAKIKEIYRYMQRLHKSAEQIRAADVAVSQHKRKKVKVRKRKKWLK